MCFVMGGTLHKTSRTLGSVQCPRQKTITSMLLSKRIYPSSECSSTHAYRLWPGSPSLCIAGQSSGNTAQPWTKHYHRFWVISPYGLSEGSAGVGLQRLPRVSTEVVQY